jgi:two-component sensor histidine kinase
MTSLRGLRIRVLLLLLVAVMPIFGLAVLWSFERDLALRRFQFHAAAASIDAATERLGRSLDRAKSLRAALAAAAGDPCSALATQLSRFAGFDAGQVIAADGTRCTASGGGDRPADATIEQLRAALAAGADPALANDGDPAGRLVIGLRPEGDAAGLVALRLSAAETSRIFDPQATPFFHGLALLDAAQPIVERHLPTEPAIWWPAGALPAAADRPRGLFALTQPDGSTADYFVTPADRPGRAQFVGLRAQTFLGSDRWRLWTSIAQLAAIVASVIVGALWAIDRSVLRWIGYLRRIAVAHSRGHHSVRAKRLASAPTELGELGESLNLMANDAGRRVALLRESAADKSALLLELHHRVKNNFQVTTSLLSLLRQDMPAPRRQEIRFVEDFVRAMAVAYRVAYDSGDVTGVVMQELLRSVVEALRDLAGTPADRIFLQIDDDPIWIDLDKAISLGLYLAVTLPPCLDAVAEDAASGLRITALQDGPWLRVAVSGAAPLNAEYPPLRRRLRSAYLRQLKALADAGTAPHETAIRIPLGDDRGTHRLAAISIAPAPAGQEAVGALVIANGCAQAATDAGIMLSGQGIDLRYRWACGAGLFGQADAAVAGRTDGELLAPAAAEALTRIKLQVLADGEPRHTVLHLTEPAPERWLAVHVQPMQDLSGRVTGVLAACHEITVYKAAEKRTTLLMREMAHRSKNILAVTEAMARQSLAYSSSLEDFSERFSARLHSLAGSHDLLTRRDWEGAHLRDLLRSQLGHYLQGDPPQITVDGPEVFLVATAIPYLGLALHELSTNAAKHGALSAAGGQVTIAWELHRDADGKERLRLSWIEAGGPPVVAPSRRGFGTDVTKRIVSRALRGDVTLDFAPGGIVWRLDVSTDNLIEQQA